MFGSTVPHHPSICPIFYLQKILNTVTGEPMTNWSHKYYVLCFSITVYCFTWRLGASRQTTAHQIMGPLIPQRNNFS